MSVIVVIMMMVLVMMEVVGDDNNGDVNDVWESSSVMNICNSL